jgi:hypothetical protein
MIISDNIGFNDIEDLGRRKGPNVKQVKLGVNVKPHRKVHRKTAFQQEEAYWPPQARAKYGHRAGDPATVKAYGQAFISAPTNGVPTVTFPSDTIQGFGYLGKGRKSGPVAPAPAAPPTPPPPPPGLPGDIVDGAPMMMPPGAAPGMPGAGPVAMPGAAGGPKGVFAAGGGEKPFPWLGVSLGAVGLLALGATMYYVFRKKPAAPGAKA